jgi:hypothetical protein
VKVTERRNDRLRAPPLLTACGRVRMHASVSCSAYQYERQVSGKGIESGKTRSRPISHGRSSELDAGNQTLDRRRLIAMARSRPGRRHSGRSRRARTGSSGR